MNKKADVNWMMILMVLALIALGVYLFIFGPLAGKTTKFINTTTSCDGLGGQCVTKEESQNYMAQSGYTCMSYGIGCPNNKPTCCYATEGIAAPGTPTQPSTGELKDVEVESLKIEPCTFNNNIYVCPINKDIIIKIKIKNNGQEIITLIPTLKLVSVGTTQITGNTPCTIAGKRTKECEVLWNTGPTVAFGPFRMFSSLSKGTETKDYPDKYIRLSIRNPS